MTYVTRILGNTTRCWRTALAHVTGLSAFVFGIVSWFTVSTIPTGHPAFGGPDPTRVLLVFLTLTCGCGLLSGIMVIHSLYARRLLRLLYTVPPLAFVGYVVIQFTRMV
jgi:hypothetical protein